jgi:secreted PhoX family phosphatase
MTEQKRLDPHSVDIDTNPSQNQEFSAVLAMRLSRRRAIVSGTSATAAVALGGLGLTACGNSDETVVVPVVAKAMPTAKGTVSLGFTSIAKSLEDKVKLPAGYQFSVLAALGDPLKNGVTAWADDGSETGDSFSMRLGDHGDAMNFFGLKEGKWDNTVSTSGVLAMNHEAISQQYLHPVGESLAEPRNENQVIKEMNAHGVTLVKLDKNATSGKFEIDKASDLTRRVTLDTEMELAGPVKGSRFVVTKYDNTGVKARGALNTCGSGKTPWGTYLTGEENWGAYFRRVAGDDTNPLRKAEEVALNKRYGINAGSVSFNDKGWFTVVPVDAANTHRFARWNASIVGTSLTGTDDYRHEANTFGYMVEIDPLNPTAKPKKRTWLGRMAHEGCWPSNPEVGKPLAFYMGDDSRNEYIYKFVTKAVWDAADIGKGLTAGDKYLNAGTLYVAKFNADGSGTWIDLTHGKNNLVAVADTLGFPFTSQAAVLVGTRIAADTVGATKMDRPEWGCVNPLNGEVYMTLTNNNTGRGTTVPVDAANPRDYDDVDGKKFTGGNPNGHIIRFAEMDSKADATSFKWDVYVFGAEADDSVNNLSKLTDDNDFSAPDGLWFDTRGVLWIQTDDGAYTDVTNCMMLAAVTGKVGDGEEISVNGQKTFKGKNPESDLRRFLVGPKDCEITGVDMTPDYKAMFVNIQHPGENGTATNFSSHWPDSETNAASSKRPRSATIVITRTDGGVIGL